MVEIIYKTKGYRFADLDAGDTFINSSGELMMKVRGTCNAIELSSGILYIFSDDTEVVSPVDCRIEVLNK